MSSEAVADEELLRFAVLRSREDIAAARRELVRRDLVDFGGRRTRLARALPPLARWIDPQAAFRSDPVKSWDVLRALELLEARLAPDDPVLDVGCFASAILPALHRRGHRRLAGIDLDERVTAMPGAGAVDYRVGDLTSTPWPDEAFAAVTAVSVIEHGVADRQLLQEVRRLLRPGGVFVFSTDYWPEKIDTSDTPLFGLPWRIFSSEEVEALLSLAREHDLEPAGDPPAEIGTAAERPIDFEGRRYTFLYGALVRR